MSYFDLVHAIDQGDTASVKRLLRDGASPNPPKVAGYESPLVTSIKKNYPDIVNALLNAGANIDHLDSSVGSTTPLIAALQSKRFGIAKVLVQRGADVNKRTIHLSPLYLAVLYDAPLAFVRLLLDRGARIVRTKSTSSFREDPLGLAARRGDYAIFRLLFSKLNPPLSTRLDDDTYLHIAARGPRAGYRFDSKGAVKIIQFLVRRGLDVNSTSSRGRTPLHVARTPGIARALVRLGANTTTRNNRGKTPKNAAGSMDIAHAASSKKNITRTTKRLRTYSIRGYRQNEFSEIVTRIHETPRQIDAFLRIFSGVDKTNAFMGRVLDAGLDRTGDTFIISAQLRNAKTGTLVPAGAASLTTKIRTKKHQPHVDVGYLTALKFARGLRVGVGSAIIDTAVGYAKEHGGKTIRLVSANTPETLKFYDRLGFSLELGSNENANIPDPLEVDRQLVERSVRYANRVGMKNLKNVGKLPNGLYVDGYYGILNIARYEKRRAQFLKSQKLGKYAPRILKRSGVTVGSPGVLKNIPGVVTPNSENVGSRKRIRTPVVKSSAKRHKMIKV